MLSGLSLGERFCLFMSCIHYYFLVDELSRHSYVIARFEGRDISVTVLKV